MVLKYIINSLGEISSVQRILLVQHWVLNSGAIDLHARVAMYFLVVGVLLEYTLHALKVSRACKFDAVWRLQSRWLILKLVVVTGEGSALFECGVL